MARSQRKRRASGRAGCAVAVLISSSKRPGARRSMAKPSRNVATWGKVCLKLAGKPKGSDMIYHDMFGSKTMGFWGSPTIFFGTKHHVQLDTVAILIWVKQFKLLGGHASKEKTHAQPCLVIRDSWLFRVILTWFEIWLQDGPLVETGSLISSRMYSWPWVTTVLP